MHELVNEGPFTKQKHGAYNIIDQIYERLFWLMYKKEKRIKKILLEMWANAQRDGRPAEYRWRPLFNAAKFG